MNSSGLSAGPRWPKVSTPSVRTNLQKAAAGRTTCEQILEPVGGEIPATCGAATAVCAAGCSLNAGRAAAATTASADTACRQRVLQPAQKSFGCTCQRKPRRKTRKTTIGVRSQFVRRLMLRRPYRRLSLIRYNCRPRKHEPGLPLGPRCFSIVGPGSRASSRVRQASLAAC